MKSPRKHMCPQCKGKGHIVKTQKPNTPRKSLCPQCGGKKYVTPKAGAVKYKDALYIQAKDVPSGFQQAWDKVVKYKGDNVIARCIHNLHPILGLVDTARKRLIDASSIFDDDSRDLEDDIMRKKVESFFTKIIAITANSNKAILQFGDELATMLMSLKRQEQEEFREEKTKSEKVARAMKKKK